MNTLKEYLNSYVSNTLGGSSNQYFFNMQEGATRKGRIFYKIFCGGEYDYSLLFSNIIDSTYANGVDCRCNVHCKEWSISEVKIGRCKNIPSHKPISEITILDGAGSDITVFDFKSVYFNGKTKKHVKEGEVFYSDPVRLYFEKDEYLCVEIAFAGTMIPCHKEIQLPTYVQGENGWEYSVYMPVPNMVGCNRKVKRRIAFLGDSITQGIGVKANSYLHWNALIAEKIGLEYAFWNLGIGFGRASDAATNGVWLKKAKQNEIVVVCYGVNDLCQGASVQDVKNALKTIVYTLQMAGSKVVLHTIPPFNYDETVREKWQEVNRFIVRELAEDVELLFDIVPILRENEEMPYNARFNGHPNEEGCALWAEALYNALLLHKIV